MKRIVFTLIVLFSLLNDVSAQITWDGGGSDLLWSTPENWTGDVVPGASDDVIFDNVTVVVEMDILTSIPTYPIKSLSIINGSHVTLEYTYTLVPTVTRILQLTSTSSIIKGLLIDAVSILSFHGNTSGGSLNYILDFSGNIGVTGEISGELQFSGVGSASGMGATRLRIYTDALNNANLVVKDGGIIRYLPETENTLSSASGGPYLTMENGSSYILEKNSGSFPSGGLWQPNSLAKVENLTGSIAASFNGDIYGDLYWNTPALSGSVAPVFLNNPTFNNVTLNSTNNFSFIVRNGGGIREFTINGDLTLIANSKIELTGSLAPSGGGGRIHLKGNLDNSGTIASSGGVGTINDFELSGSVNQSISCAGAFTGNVNFIMNNAAGATLNTPLTLPYNLTLTNGNINTTATNILTLADDATSSVGSPTSFVNGPMKKIGDDDFVFPVGTSTGPGGIYAPIGISGIGGNPADEFTAEYFRTNPQSAFGSNYGSSGINHVSYVEYWTLDRNIGSTTTKNVALDVHATSFCRVENTTFVSQFNGTSWTQEVSTGSGFNTCNAPYLCGTLTTNNPISDFTLTPSIFSLATTDPFATNPLPIKLIDFTATKISNTLANVNWELAVCCSKDAIFELEKSTDSRNFSLLTTVNGNETNRYYTYNDNRLAKGINYYRLKMIDVDGSITYSKVIAIVNNENGFIITSITPNPVQSSAIISLSSAKKEAAHFQVYNMAGTLVRQWYTVIAEGSNTVNMNVAGLAAGAYQLVVYSNDSRSNFRFIKQ